MEVVQILSRLAEAKLHVARVMKASANTKPFLVSIMATPVFLLAAAVFAGAGDGSYLLAKILFPFTMLSTRLTKPCR